MHRKEYVNVRVRVLRFLRGKPYCSELEVMTAWAAAVHAAHPRNDRWQMVPGAKLLSLYCASLDPGSSHRNATFLASRDWLTDYMAKRAPF